MRGRQIDDGVPVGDRVQSGKEMNDRLSGSDPRGTRETGDSEPCYIGWEIAAERALQFIGTGCESLKTYSLSTGLYSKEKEFICSL